MGHGVGSGQETVDSLLVELTRFTGEEREQEDDIVALTLERSKAGMTDRKSTLRPDATGHNGNRRILADFTLPNEPGNERLAMEKVAVAIEQLRPSEQRLERLKSAVTEATMNAMEHGNKYRSEVPVEAQVEVVDRDLMVRITDSGSGPPPTASLSCAFPYEGMMPPSEVLRAEALFIRVRGIGVFGSTSREF